MIFGPHLSSVLRLLLPSEHRVDLAAAQASFEGQDSPKALLELGKVLLCAGKVKQARAVLSRAEALTSDPGEMALTGAYRLLSDLADYGASREWAPGSLPLELARRWSFSAWTIERDSCRTRLHTLPTAVEQEVWFVTEIVPIPNELPSVSTEDEVRLIWARLRKANERLSQEDFRREVAIGTGIVKVIALRLADQRSAAREIAIRSVEQYRRTGDGLGAGLFALLVDELKTTSRTVPEVIDLYAGDAADLNRTTMEALEEGPLPQRQPDWQALLQGRSPARTIFEESGWALGVAAALVQIASWITRAKPADSPPTLEIQQLIEAKDIFDRVGDDAGKYLVQCRMIAIGVEQNSPLEALLRGAREIGVWGRNLGSVSFALGLGYFILAVARSWRRRGNLAFASRALNVANALFDALEAPVAEADAAMEEADFLASEWESSQAVPSLQRALDKYIEAITALGVPTPGYLAAWQRLRSRVAQAAAALLSATTGYQSLAKTQQKVSELNIMPRMTV